MIENLKKNIKNKTWWISIISALIVLLQTHGVDLTKYIGTDWQSTINTVFSIVVLLGISVDTTTSTSNTVSNSTENTIQADSTSTNNSTENSSDATDDKNAIQLSNSIVPKENTAD